MSDDFLDQLQADVFGILSHTPSLALAHKVLDNKGDLEGEIENHLATVNDDSGKCGLAVIVLAVEVEKAEENLPGPPLNVRVDVQTLEMVELNRHPTNGTLIHSATAATRVIAALHHVTLGSCILHAGKNPLRPLPLRAGFVGHIVSLHTRLNGVAVSSRPFAVQAELTTGGDIAVTGTLTPNATGVLVPCGIVGGQPAYSSDGNDYPGSYPWSTLRYRPETSEWVLQCLPTDFPAFEWTSPTKVGGYDPQGASSGYATVSNSGDQLAIALTCASPDSSIHYTTDGSYPSPAKTLYTAPIASPQTGTVFRAAAYVAGMPPGDVLDFTVRD